MKELEYPFDAAYINKKFRSLKKELLKDGSGRIKKRIALLGGFTTAYIKQSLELFLLNYGIEPSFYESDFGLFYEDALFSNDRLEDFAPDLIYICTCNRNIQGYPAISCSKKQRDELVEGELSRLERVWDALEKRFNVPVLQNNFEKPLLRILGNNDGCDHRGKTSFINELNVKLAEALEQRRNLFLIDLDYISSYYGLKAFSDPFYWYLCKSAVSLEAAPTLAFNIANVIKALCGKNKKALVLDLDNTLWGGVIAEDGVQGIRIGQESSEDQAYLAFQQYIKELMATGIISTVSSKNDGDQALCGLRHPEGILRSEDFALIKADWKPKSENVRAIATELGILPESLVFMDDNPAERAEVTGGLPQVAAPELGDIAHRCELIDCCGFFENVKLSADDLKRNEMYKENMQRTKAAALFKDYGEYLDSLQMRAEIKPFCSVFYSRIAQLCNKSNQFNLTTVRYDEQQIAAMAEDPTYVTLYASLKDRFGDNGVVSLFIGEIVADTLLVRLWLMSCRVLKRDLEKAMADTVVSKARTLGLKAIEGSFIPSGKNEMVRALYPTLGYEKIKEDQGVISWQLRLQDDCGRDLPYECLNTHISVQE